MRKGKNNKKIEVNEGSVNYSSSKVHSNGRNKPDRRKIFFWILLISVMILVFAKLSNNLLGNLGKNPIQENTPIGGIELDKNAEIGSIEQRSQEEIQSELNAKVEASMINISMNLSPIFKDGKSRGNLLIVNEEVNNYMQVIEIYREDTSELIYKSGGIPVGSKIETATLDVNLPKGVYKCIAYFNAIDDKTGALIGKAGAMLDITIQN